MLPGPVMFVGKLTGGVAFMTSTLFETSVLGSGVSWAREVRLSATRMTGKATPQAIDFMRPILADALWKAEAISKCRVACSPSRSGGLQTAVFLVRRFVNRRSLF